MNLYGWIIYPRYVSQHSDNAFGWLTDEAAACGIELDIIFSEDLTICYGGDSRYLKHNGTKVDLLPEFVLIRTYDNVISRFFESSGIPVINTTESMEVSKNKMLTHEILSAAGLPTPPTVYSDGGGYRYAELSEMFGSRFIVKRIDGAKGEDVYLIDNEADMKSAVEKCNYKCICQKFIAESMGRDVRVWVIGFKAAGSVLRYSETSFLSNFSQGGQVSVFPMTDEVAGLAVAGCRELGIEFAGVDLLFTENGFTINEINGNAGFRTLSRIGNNNIPHELFDYIKHKYEKH